MLSHYFRIAWRIFRRNTLYSLINIGCLALGIAAAMTILLYVLHERSYDRWQANSDRIFKVSVSMKVGNSSVNFDHLSYAAAPSVLHSDPRVESYVRAYSPRPSAVLRDANRPEAGINAEKPGYFADSNFFQFFSFRLMQGDPATVLVRPNTVVLTATTANLFFGTVDAIGKMLLYNGDQRLEVTGVCADPPSNTTIDFAWIGSGSSMHGMPELAKQLASPDVQGGSFLTWLRLTNAEAAGPVTGTMNAIASNSPDTKDSDKDRYTLTKLREIHLQNNFGDASNTRYLVIFPLVAGLILLLALVNYMSLATARSVVRAKEVGVRKVLGGGRASLARQFYAESTLMATIAFAAGILLFLLIKPAFLRLLQLPIDDSFLLSPGVLGAFGLLLLLVIAIGGSYPALVLSAFRPVVVLYGKLSRRRGGEKVRKGFLIFQFGISMSLILCSVILEKQIWFIRHTDTGVNRENVVMIPFSTHLAHYEAYKREIESLPGVTLAATAHYALYHEYDAFFVNSGGKSIMLPVMSVDDHFISVLGLQWKHRPVLESVLYDNKHILLNEAAVSKLGLHGDPVGQTVDIAGNFVVAGVLKNFNYQNMQEPIGPLCLFVGKDTASGWGTTETGCLIARIQPHVNLPTLLGDMTAIYRKYDRQTPFSYQFLDDAFNAQYKAEDRLAGLLGIFTAITIVIACLGLFALATFAAQQRLKEIGIRKVLGASASSISSLLSRDFLRPVLISVLIASPLAWWVMSKWLQNFAFRTSISWWIFPAAAGGLLLIAHLTVLFRAIKAARANPTINLRSE